MPSNPIGYALKVVFQFLEGGTGKTGLADISIKGWRWTTKVRDGVSITQELENGLYVYLMPAEYNDSADMYIFNAHTDNADVDQQDVAAIQMSFVWVGYIDQSLSTTESNIRGADSDTLETLSDQLDTISLSGTNLVTISVDDGADAVSDVRVEIRDSGGHYVTHAMTDGDGEAIFNLDDGTYSVYCRKPGYVFTLPETVTVNEDPETATISGTSVSVPSPGTEDSVTCYEYCYDQDTATGLQKVTAYAEILEKPFTINSRSLNTQRKEPEYSTDTFLASWELPRGALVRFYIEELGLDIIRPVPTDPEITTIQITEMPSLESLFDELPTAFPFKH